MSALCALPVWPFALASVCTAYTRATRWHDSTLAVITIEQPNLMQIVLPKVDGTLGALTVALGHVLVNARPAKHVVAPSENHVLVLFLQGRRRPRVRRVYECEYVSNKQRFVGYNIICAQPHICARTYTVTPNRRVEVGRDTHRETHATIRISNVHSRLST
jgi:hypothetical protein